MKNFGKFSSKRDEFSFSTTDVGFGTFTVKVMRSGPRAQVQDESAIVRDGELAFRFPSAAKEAKYDIADLRKAMEL